MAISMSGATVDTSERDSLLQSNVDGGVVQGGVTANTRGTGFLGLGGQEATGAALAGITESFASHVSTAIETYKSNVQTELDKLQSVESNEAFAAQSIAVARELKFNMDIVNVNGGAIAIGHPIGASGARILTTLLYEMKKRGNKRGLATLCIGGGMGTALVVEM